MKISEAMDRLLELGNLYGDLDLYCYSSDINDKNELKQIELIFADCGDIKESLIADSNEVGVKKLIVIII